MIWKIFAILQNHLLLFSLSFWWNHDQYLSMFILKNPHILCHSLNKEHCILPGKQLHSEVLMADGIHKLWQISKIGSAICMSNALDLFLIIQHNNCLIFRGNCLWCFWFDALLYNHQSLCMIECWKTIICQYLNCPHVHHSISCIRILITRRVSQNFTNL